MITYLPKPLRKNSTIGLICPAGGLKSSKDISKSVKYLEDLAYKVKVGRSLLANNGYKYLSDTDEKRLFDLYNFWEDKSVDAVFCLRGGYGCLRLLNLIDFNRIKKNKKILLGFSDITVLLLSFYKKCNLVTFHGPMLGNKTEKTSANNLWKLLVNQQFQFSYKSKGFQIVPGKTKGKLLGGNLTNVCSMIGSGFLPDFRGSILLLEDCHEEPYKIDRLLTQISNAGIFNQVNGIVFSSFYKCGFKKNNEIIALLKDKVAKYKKPTLYNFPVGHNEKNYAVPIGLDVQLDVGKFVLSSL